MTLKIKNNNNSENGVYYRIPLAKSILIKTIFIIIFLDSERSNNFTLSVTVLQ